MEIFRALATHYMQGSHAALDEARELSGGLLDGERSYAQFWWDEGIRDHTATPGQFYRHSAKLFA